MDQPRPRITGTEMEWGLSSRLNAQSPYAHRATDAKAAVNYHDKRLRKTYPSGMLSNGGRLYVDLEHPEYATPEDTSFMGTVANEIAGERIVYDALEKAKAAGVVGDFILTKRVVDDELNTWGYHVNFCADVSRINIDNKSLAPLGIHLATANILIGAGSILHTNEGTKYTIGQKVLNLNNDFAGSSHAAQQPLISLRNESLAGKKYERVHITSFDANMSPWATWMKLGTTSIIIRMIEKGYIQHMDTFEDDMHRIAIDVAHDPNLLNSYKLEDGRHVRAIDIQYELMQLGKKMADAGELPDEECRIVGEWERALTDLATDPSRVIDRVEWIAKRQVLNGYMAKHALSLSDDLVREKDRQWSYIGPLGIGAKLREGRWAPWMPSEARIEHAYLHPPSTTRALVRVCLINYFHDVLKEGAQVHWSSVQRNPAGRYKAVELDDPYDHLMPGVPWSQGA